MCGTSARRSARGPAHLQVMTGLVSLFLDSKQGYWSVDVLCHIHACKITNQLGGDVDVLDYQYIPQDEL
jgi:hypothetical protein